MITKKTILTTVWILFSYYLFSQHTAYINIDTNVIDCGTDSSIIYDPSTIYNEDIFGLGHDASLLYNSVKSTSTSYPAVTFELTTNISSDNFLVSGHNNGPLTRTTVDGESDVIGRVWYSDMTGNVGTINVELDLLEIAANVALAPTNVKIGIANNPGLNNIYFIEASSVTSGIALFEGVPLYDKYFTFKAAQ